MNAVAVAELVMGHMINLDRRIADNVADLRAHKWNKKEYSKARGLKGSTLGIVGLGRIGTEVAKRALAFDMNVLWYDVVPNLKGPEHPNCQRVELDRLFRESDFVTLHVPGTGDTKHLVNAARLATMKPDAMIINTSRASVIDEPALIAALKEKEVRAARRWTCTRTSRRRTRRRSNRRWRMCRICTGRTTSGRRRSRPRRRSPRRRSGSCGSSSRAATW